MELSRFYLTYLLVFVSLAGFSQSFYKVIGTTGSDFAEQVINDRDSGYIVVGGTEGLGQGEMDGYMIKLDTAGAVQWTRTFGSAGVDWLTSAVLLDDGMLVCGYSNISEDYQIYVVRTNEIGQVVWEKHFGNENWDFPQEMALVNDTTVIIAGKTYQNDVTTDGFLASVNINGDSLWYQTYGGVDDDNFERVLVSDSGQIYFCGSYMTEEDSTDYWVGRVDDEGTLLWELMLGDTLADYGHGIAELITGEFVVTGGDNDGATTQIDNKFYKIDSTGNVLYQNILNNPSDDIGIDVISYPDTNSFILVNTSSSVGFGGFDTWIFDCNYYTYGIGDLSFSFGTPQDEEVIDADTTFDKGIITVGNMFDENLGNVIFVYKTIAGESLLTTYQVEEDLQIESSNGGHSVMIYPNPTQGNLFLEGENFIDKTYRVISLSGAVIREGVLQQNQLSLSLEQGVYLFQVGETIHKLVIEKP